MMPSKVPDYPWKKVGSDLFELNGFNYLIVVDYLSAFVEIAQLSSTTSPSIVNRMKSMFAGHSTRQKHSVFSPQRMDSHITSSPKYPQANAAAERVVKTIKEMLKKSVTDDVEVPANAD